ncbi:MAG: pilus assembly protein PilM [Bdellovibrionales bacterium]|nr:pilus assembly protein PilM [Bdellovibrionales bacterium]
MRVLSIDLGSWSVKAVELDTSFGRYEIHDYHEERVREGQTPAQTAGRMVRALSRAPEAIVVGLPQGKVTFRNLHLPTRDRREIQNAIAFELEDELPFETDDSVFDHSILSQGSDGTHVHIAGTLKRHVAELLAELQEEGIDPDVVTTEAWAIRGLINRIVDKGVQESPVMVACLGDAHSTLQVHWKGFPVLSRRVSWGGKQATEALARHYGIPREEAENAKIQSGFILASEPRGRATPDQIEFSDALMEGLKPLFTEIRQTALSARNLTQMELKSIFLCGGTSLLPGLRSVLEEQNQLPSYPAQALSAVSLSGLSYSEETDASQPIAAALALTQVGQERGKTPNLRRGELSKAGASQGIDFKTLRKPLIAAGSVAASLFLSLAFQSSVYDSRMEELDLQVERSLKTFFGPLSASAVRTYLSNPERLKRAVRSELEKEREISALFNENPHSPLDFLNSLSGAVPKDIVVDMVSFTVGAAPGTPYDRSAAERGGVSFVLESKESEERLERLLGGLLAGVRKEESATLPPGQDGKQRFKVSFSGTPTESSYGK